MTKNFFYCIRSFSRAKLYEYFAFLLLFCILSGCTKERSISMDLQAENITPNLDALSFLEDDKDQENHQINQIIYLFGKATQRALKEPDMLSLMQEYLDKDLHGFGTSISDLAEKNTTFAALIATTLRLEAKANGLEYLIDLDENDNKLFVKKLADKMSCRGKIYAPVFYRLNKQEIAPRDQDVIVAIAEEVTDEDDVLAYRNDEVNPFLLSEQMANTTTDILIFVGVGEIPPGDINPIIVGDGSSDSDQIAVRMDIDIDADRHQIKNGYRYENSTKSEVKGWILKFAPNVLFGNEAPLFWQDFTPRNIHKDDINASKIFTEDLDLFGFNPTDFNNDIFAFVGAWENDWYASAKLVANTCSDVSQHNVKVNMKFSHEWYIFDCGQAKTWWPSVGSHKVFENQKCMFDLKRTQ